MARRLQSAQQIEFSSLLNSSHVNCSRRVKRHSSLLNPCDKSRTLSRDLLSHPDGNREPKVHPQLRLISLNWIAFLNLTEKIIHRIEVARASCPWWSSSLADCRWSIDDWLN